MTKKRERPKIYEKNEALQTVRWRYIDESPDKFGFQKYKKAPIKEVEDWRIITKKDYNTLKNNGYRYLTPQGRKILKDVIQHEVLE